MRKFFLGHAQNRKATLAIYYDFHKPQFFLWRTIKNYNGSDRLLRFSLRMPEFCVLLMKIFNNAIGAAYIRNLQNNRIHKKESKIAVFCFRNVLNLFVQVRHTFYSLSLKFVALISLLNRNSSPWNSWMCDHPFRVSFGVCGICYKRSQHNNAGAVRCLCV